MPRPTKISTHLKDSTVPQKADPSLRPALAKLRRAKKARDCLRDDTLFQRRNRGAQFLRREEELF
jgi:hypothetical protein